jgi:Zn finger protein HypA/HybF involved in hydrogenase expression
MNGEYKYTGECLICNIQSAITVYEEEEVPVFCPLCGSTVDFESDNDEEEDE